MSAAASMVILSNAGRYPEVRLKELRRWADEVLSHMSLDRVDVAARFTSDREMSAANRRFRGKEGTTDVLSFPGGGRNGAASEGGSDHEYLGDILISVPQARRQAASHGHSTERELRFLLLHGLLHCAGFDHETDDGEMVRLERRLRRRWIPS